MKSWKSAMAGWTTLLALALALALAVWGCRADSSGTTREISITACAVNPASQHASRSGPDAVRWHNHDGVAHTLTFGTSPFVGGVTTINVPANANSATYTIDTNAAKGGYGYWIECLAGGLDSATTIRFTAASPESGGGPSVVVDD